MKTASLIAEASAATAGSTSVAPARPQEVSSRDYPSWALRPQAGAVRLAPRHTGHARLLARRRTGQDSAEATELAQADAARVRPGAARLLHGQQHRGAPRAERAQAEG